jgi:hypothetical protein
MGRQRFKMNKTKDSPGPVGKKCDIENGSKSELDKKSHNKNQDLVSLRAYFFLSGCFLSGFLYLQNQSGRNYCLWFTIYSMNILASFMVSAQPKGLSKVFLSSKVKNHFFANVILVQVM